MFLLRSEYWLDGLPVSPLGGERQFDLATGIVFVWSVAMANGVPKPFSKSVQLREQQRRILEISEVLSRHGHSTVNQQAKILNVPRSTAWTILRPTHKHSGLTVRVLLKMLNSPELPPEARQKVLDYLHEKADGRFGSNRNCQRRFKTKAMQMGLVLTCSISEQTVAGEGLESWALCEQDLIGAEPMPYISGTCVFRAG
jgi:hypothetical protein